MIRSRGYTLLTVILSTILTEYDNECHCYKRQSKTQPSVSRGHTRRGCVRDASPQLYGQSSMVWERESLNTRRPDASKDLPGRNRVNTASTPLPHPPIPVQPQTQYPVYDSSYFIAPRQKSQPPRGDGGSEDMAATERFPTKTKQSKPTTRSRLLTHKKTKRRKTWRRCTPATRLLQNQPQARLVPSTSYGTTLPIIS